MMVSVHDKKQFHATRRAAWGKALVLMAALSVCLPGVLPGREGKAPSREASILLSDGTVLHGTVLLTPGNDFNLVGIDATVKWNKMNEFNVDVIREMTFKPYKESYQREFTFSEIQWTTEQKVDKVYRGEPYPVLEPQCTVVFNSGEERTGILKTTVIYLKEKDPDTGMETENRKFFLKSKMTGKQGADMSSLVYVTRIKMLDEGKKVERSLDVEFATFDAASASDLQAITQDTLTSVPVKAADGNKKVEVLSTFGENVFLAARIGDRYVAGWPEEGTERTDLFKQVEEQFMKKVDYYNEKKLLGILPLDNGRRVLSLVSLRRQVPEGAYTGMPGFFEKDGNGENMEFFRLSVWMWHRDPETGTMALVDRGSFYRVKVADKAATPAAGTSPDLWPVVKQDGKLLVGKKKEVEK
ncbi:MAG: hypothetical protein NTV46_20620 [Verrucomicrobia bacterium]|nr:hypothetical protein [Verrucomicrobiota bacterium]